MAALPPGRVKGDSLGHFYGSSDTAKCLPRNENEAFRMSDKSDRMSDRQMKDYRITVRLPVELRRRLKDAAERASPPLFAEQWSAAWQPTMRSPHTSARKRLG